jgi:hypothetical protein
MSNADNSRVAVFPGYRAPDDRVAEEALARAMRRVAPLWPLDNFVAVNPFLGFSDEPFLEAAQRVRAACDAPLLMPRRHYCQALRDGRITDADLKQALESAAAAGDLSVEALRAAAASADPEPAAVFPTVAAAVARLSGNDWSTHRQRAHFPLGLGILRCWSGQLGLPFRATCPRMAVAAGNPRWTARDTDAAAGRVAAICCPGCRRPGGIVSAVPCSNLPSRRTVWTSTCTGCS